MLFCKAVAIKRVIQMKMLHFEWKSVWIVANAFRASHCQFSINYFAKKCIQWIVSFTLAQHIFNYFYCYCYARCFSFSFFFHKHERAAVYDACARRTSLAMDGWMVSKEYLNCYMFLLSGCTMFRLITNLIQLIAFGRRWYYFKCFSFFHLNFPLLQYWWLYRHFVAACIKTTESNLINGNKWEGFRKPVYVYHKLLASGKCEFQFSCYKIVDAGKVFYIFFEFHMNLTCFFFTKPTK